MTTADSKNKAGSQTKYGYFLGCVMPVKMPWAEKATMLVSKHLGLDFGYMKETLCCVRPGPWKAMNLDWWLSITGQNLANAEKQGIVMVDTCNGCYVSHWEALQELQDDPKKVDLVNAHLVKAGMDPLKGTAKVKHYVEILYEDVGMKKIKANVVTPLKGIRIMRHVGCHIRRRGDDTLLNYFEEILKATGVELVDTPYDKTCCGLLLYFSDANSSIFERIGKKMETAKELNVDGYTLICSGCYDQFERAIKIYRDERGIAFPTPIIHFSELLALAFGYKPEDFGMKTSRCIPVDAFIEKVMKLREGK
jgi:heterodisulfide reductase subunit B